LAGWKLARHDLAELIQERPLATITPQPTCTRLGIPRVTRWIDLSPAADGSPGLVAELAAGVRAAPAEDHRLRDSLPATRRGLRVSELAETVGVTPDTIRYYERAGLLPAAARTPAGYRAYDAGAVDRLQFIQGAQRLGLKLREIADLLAVRDTGVRPCEPAEQLLRRRLTELDAEMARLTTLRAEMVAMIDGLPSDNAPTRTR
jgi:DNA-binding transcriptional MerR regulator